MQGVILVPMSIDYLDNLFAFFVLSYEHFYICCSERYPYSWPGCVTKIKMRCSAWNAASTMCHNLLTIHTIVLPSPILFL